MKEKIIEKIPKRLFHLSEENHDGEWFRPRIPESIIEYGENKEDDKVKRICFSTSITGAFYAINFDGHWQKLYIHVPENIEDIVRRRKLCKPTEDQVFDVNYCDEYWVKCKVKLKCIGYISISYHMNFLENRPKVKFKYIKKFNND